MQQLVLYIGNKNYSSWSMRPWLLMKTAGIPFEEVLIRFDFENGNTAIKAVSESGKVPLLVDDGLKIWETLAIAEYLAERFPEKAIWPRDAASRATARSVSAEMASGFSALRGRCPLNMRRTPAPLAVDDAVRADIARIAHIWKSALQVSGGPFLFGAFSAADAMFAPVVGRLSTYQLTPSDEAARYMETVKALAAWAEWEADALREPWIVAEDEV